MKVLKFGGTSVGSIESLRNVKNIVENIDGSAIIVVSALGGLTDKLIATAKIAASNDMTYNDEFINMEKRHMDIIHALVPDNLKHEVIDKIECLLSDLKRIYDGVFLLRHLPEMTMDIIVSFGERMSSVIIAAVIDGGSHHDSLNFIKTEKWYDKNIADQRLTTELIRENFSRPYDKAIVPGFIATDKVTGNISNLGRGGSDFTAALIAAAMDADTLEIWTDVDGFLSADPRIIKDAVLIPHMTFIESMELCSYGAKVIYPPTIYPVFHKNIPIRILNTFNPEVSGTLITESAEEGDFPIKGISTIKDTTLFHIGGNISGKAISTVSRTFNALAKRGVKVFNVSHCNNHGRLSFAVAKNDAEITNNTICKEFAPELTKGIIHNPERIDNISTIAVVGESMRNKKRLGARIRNTLARNGITVEGYSEETSDSTMVYLIPARHMEEALKNIHNLIFTERADKHE